MRAYPFATVVVHAASGFVANHLPFEVAGDALLHGHVARGNELAQMDGAEVLVIFQGPDGYISPNWYPSKHETGREVPTWNYAVVHVHGRLQVIDDAAWMRQLLETLTDRHEAMQPKPWHVSDAPADHREILASDRRHGDHDRAYRRQVQAEPESSEAQSAGVSTACGSAMATVMPSWRS
jgi:transcriptional regulator